MVKRMLIDATHAEETRVVVMEGRKLESFDAEYASQKPLKGNIYLARIERVEPSLQAAFVDFGEDRHGFLGFNEIHPDYFQIPVADREELLALQREAEAIREAASVDEVNPSSDEEQGEDASESEEAQASAIEEDSGEEEASEAEESDAQETDGEDEEPSPEEGESHPEKTSFGEDYDDEEESDEELQIHRRIRQILNKYRIQEVIRQRQVVLVQVVKEERGNKGAALTTYISLAGRYCVLMPNALRSGGVSRKITSLADRKRLRDIVRQQELGPGMAVIVRTAGAQRTKAEITRDCTYLLQLWDSIRELTFRSIAPALIYEEASLIKRAIRDVYTRDIDEIIVDGEAGWKATRSFMRMLMPHHTGKIQIWRKRTPSLFSHYHVEKTLDAMFSTNVPLRSGGYLVINQTEALVAVDVNSGKATHQRNVEQTALRTNKEAAEEVALQMRLRDLAGLIVIDFIDMDNRRHNHTVENHLKNALKRDKARIQVGSISRFGLLEMSRQRLRPSVAETAFKTCVHCQGTGMTRTADNAALSVLRSIEEAAPRHRFSLMTVFAATDIALFILNNKREWLSQIEERYKVHLSFHPDPSEKTTEIRIAYKRLDPSLFNTKKKRLQEQNAKETISEDTLSEMQSDEEESAPPEQSPARPRRTRRRDKARTPRRGRGRSARAEETADVTPEQDVENPQESSGEDETLAPKRRRTRRTRSSVSKRGGRGRRGSRTSTPPEGEETQATPEALDGEDKVSTPVVPEGNEQQAAEAPTSVEATPQDVSEKAGDEEAVEEKKPTRKRRATSTRTKRTRRAPRKPRSSAKEEKQSSSEEAQPPKTSEESAAKKEDKAASKAAIAEAASDGKAQDSSASAPTETKPARPQQEERESKVVQPTSVDDIPKQKRRKTGWWT